MSEFQFAGQANVVLASATSNRAMERIQSVLNSERFNDLLYEQTGLIVGDNTIEKAHRVDGTKNINVEFLEEFEGRSLSVAQAVLFPAIVLVVAGVILGELSVELVRQVILTPRSGQQSTHSREEIMRRADRMESDVIEQFRSVGTGVIGGLSTVGLVVLVFLGVWGWSKLQ